MPSTIKLQTWNQVITQSQTELVSEQLHIQHERSIAQARETPTIQNLKPTDGGTAAWGLLAAAFVFEACFCYLGAPLSTTIAKRFPKFQRHQIWLGWPLCILSLVAGSFAETLNGLIATQGVMYELGFVILTYPIYSFVDEWFVARKGMAFGIVSAASGFTGMFVPFIIEILLHKYGYKTTLRAIAVAISVLTAPLIPFLKGKLPPADQSARAKTNWGFVKRPLFWIYGASTLMQNFGFFFPALYLPL
ncbi:Fujikurins efflux protein [Lachnellula cervina]|uniref:Fujikurins efflux protein n=1 Tax=Lachnellula cervina TaxID=1316786 RepID=A0A7D8UV29_9HELO|nr:Fujikurins efflux protein [Lachnellula cervina]